MPSSLSSRGVWTVIGLDGAYNPIISPPSILTNLDSAWNYKCSAGPFQGNDPPIALNAQPTMQVPASPTPDGHSITSMMPAPAHSTPTPVMLTSRSGIDTFPYHTVPGLNWPVETSSSKSETDPPPQNGKDSDRGNPILQFVPQTLTLAPTLASSSHLNIVGYDLTPGGTVIVSGTTLSRNANGRSILVLGGDTASKTDIVNAADPANNADPPLITAASQIIGVLANTGSSGDNAGDEKGQNTISGEHNNDGNEDGGNQNEQTDPLKFTPSSAGSFKGAKRSEIFKILAVVWIGLIEIIY